MGGCPRHIQLLVDDLVSGEERIREIEILANGEAKGFSIQQVTSPLPFVTLTGIREARRPEPTTRRFLIRLAVRAPQNAVTVDVGIVLADSTGAPTEEVLPISIRPQVPMRSTPASLTMVSDQECTVPVGQVAIEHSSGMAFKIAEIDVPSFVMLRGAASSQSCSATSRLIQLAPKENVPAGIHAGIVKVHFGDPMLGILHVPVIIQKGVTK